jgi:hypothetical protein
MAVSSLPGLLRRAEDLVKWMIVIRAVALHRSDRTWEWVAQQLHVHPRTIARAVRRCLGVHLPDVDAFNQRSVTEVFNAHVLSPILLCAEATKSPKVHHSVN